MKFEMDGRCSECIDLACCQRGTGGIVTCVLRTAANASTVRRMAELGLRRGAVIEAGQKTPGGGRVITVAGSQLALDADTLRFLHVSA